MGQRAQHFTYRGELRQAPRALSRLLWRLSVAKAWARAVEREGPGLAWLILAASWCVAHVLVLALGESWALGLGAINGVYALGALGLWWTTRTARRLDEARAVRLHRWLEVLGEAMPEGTSLDVDVRLGRGGCGGASSCAHPWLVGQLFLPRGTTLDIRVTEGRSCPVVRRKVAQGRSLVQVELGGEVDRLGLHGMEALAGWLERSTCPKGFRSRKARHDGLYRVRWMLEQDHHAAGDTLPIWPLVRLAAARWDRAWMLDAEHSAQLHSAQPGQPILAGVAGAQTAPNARVMPLRAPRAALPTRLRAGRARLKRLMGSPSLVLMALLMMVNGAVGAGTLGIVALQRAVEHAGAAHAGRAMLWTEGAGAVGWGWLAFFATSLVLGCAILVPILRRWAAEAKRAQASESIRVGALRLDDTHLTCEQGDTGRVDIDLARPFRVHLTREVGYRPDGGKMRLFMTVTQRDASARACVASQACALSRVGVSVEVDADESLMRVPAKHAAYPEVEPEDFALLWAELEHASQAHGVTLPAAAEAVGVGVGVEVKASGRA